MADTPLGTNLDVAKSYFESMALPGILVRWDRITPSGVVLYNILSSTHIDGNYSLIGTVDFPQDEFVDNAGNPSKYYKVEEINASGAVIATSQPFSGDEYLLISSILYEVRQFTRKMVYREMGIFEGTDRSWCRFAYNNWNYWPRPQIFISGVSNDGDKSPLIVLSENTPIYKTISGNVDNYADGLLYRLDYQGRVHFFRESDGSPYVIHPYDTIYATYAVKMFTNYEINAATTYAFQAIVSRPGAPKITSIGQMPFYWEQGVVQGATYWLYRQLLANLNDREWRLLAQDPDRDAYDAIKDLRETMKSYYEDWKDALKTLPISKYPAIRSIVGQTHMLPGGRSRFFRQIWGKGM